MGFVKFDKYNKLKHDSKFLEFTFYLIIIIFYFSRYFYTGDGYLAFFDDDFYYYLETAYNFSQTGISTFDNIHETNGYHPLWFLILSSITFFFGKKIIAFYIVSFIQVITTYLVYKQISILFEKILPEINYSKLTSIIITSFFMLIFKGGMEVILTVPLLLLLINKSLEEITSSYEIGLISLFAILSRLDSIFFIAIYVLFLIYLKKVNIFKFSLTMLPFIIYLLSNIIIFDTLMPISGMAKQLRTELYFESNVIRSFFDNTLNRIFYGTIPGILILVNIFLIIIKYKANDKKINYLFISILIFQISLVMYQSFFSGWVYWSWYFYSIIFSYIITTYYLLKYLKLNKNLILLFTITILLYNLAFSFFKKPTSYDIYNEANEIKNFEKKYVGIYGMGDRAGLPSYYINSNLIQLEGLMMNRQYLEDLKSMKLIDLLKKYNVEYYISYNPKPLGGKFVIAEPIKLFEKFINSYDTITVAPIDSAFVGSGKFYLFNIKEAD